MNILRSVLGNCTMKVVVGLVCLFPIASFAKEVPVGEDINVMSTLPDTFLSEQLSEEGETLFIMPRKDDYNGPSSLRITVASDLRNEKMSIQEAREMFGEFAKAQKSNAKVQTLGANLLMKETPHQIEDEGTRWKIQNYSIWVDGFLCTATMQTVGGREGEPQYKELTDALEPIFKSLRPSTEEERVEYSKTLNTTGYDEQEMDAAIQTARKKVDGFIKALEAKVGENHAVKVRITDGEDVEHVWLSNITYKDAIFSGTIGNVPAIVRNVKLGQPYDVKKDEITDWVYFKGEKMHGNYTIRPMLKSMPEEQRKHWEEIMVD